jgi:hypothetical protein
VLWGFVAGIVVVTVAVVAVVALPMTRSPMTKPGDRVLIVVAGRGGTDGGQVAQMIAVADMTGGGLRVGLVDPLTSVTVPGTSAGELRDAYAFGGGKAVSSAYARVSGAPALPVVALAQQAFVTLVDRSGGVTVTVHAATSVFDGTRLYSFPAGSKRLSGSDVVALLSSGDYLKTAEERTTLRSAVASGVASAFAKGRPGIGDLVDDGTITSSLNRDDLAALGGRLQAALGDRSFVVLAR